MKASRTPDPARSRELLAQARLMLLFTPGLCAPRDPFEVLEDVVEFVDVVQIRPKAEGSGSISPARETYDDGLRVIELIAARTSREILVIVDDRVDVAAALQERGCAGVHLGQEDCPVAVARERLGAGALIGLSTHDMRQIGAAWEQPVDYLGFGPLHATPTKGYASGLGPEAAWIASQGSPFPLFPIGGIEPANIDEIARIGRAAVGAAILRAEDPAAAARELRDALAP